MLRYCTELESGSKKHERDTYVQILNGIKAWYTKQHKDYERMLQNELIGQLCDKILTEEAEDNDWQECLTIQGLSDNWQAKLNLYSAADIMCKQILSKYTYGPDASMPVDFKSPRGSWLSSRLSVFDIYELLQLQLYTHNEGQRINLSALMEERSVRSNLTHSGQISVCLSAIRCYNVLREMIILMDDTVASVLPRFSYPSLTACDIQKFLQYTGQINFEEEHTVLVVGSLHDISSEGKTLLANLPWTLVLDFDGYTEFGGLRSCTNNCSIHDQKMTLATANQYCAPKGYTTWYTCGDFCDFEYCNSSNDVNFKTRSSFNSNYHAIQGNLRTIFSTLLSVLSQQLKPINIIFLHNRSSIAKDFLEQCGKYYNKNQYRFTCLYYYPQEEWDTVLSGLNPRKRGSSQQFFMNSLSCDLDSFFSGLVEYRTAFPPSKSPHQINMLPSDDGLKQIASNTALNLNLFFDVLYSNIGDEQAENVQALISAFYHGSVVPWCAFKSDRVVPLMRKSDYDRNLALVRNSLKRIPDKAEHKIINLTHEPGIGGSTLLRQIGWDLHLEYPVLVVRKYDKQISSQVMQLYDELKKGILILADETINEIDKLKDDIRKLPRACALVIAGRSNHLLTGKNEKHISFSAITSASEDKLKTLFKEYSNLTGPEKQKKDLGYFDFINQSQVMHCPFMIGLYYLDRTFNGVDEYVNQIMDAIHDRREIETVALIALCDYYGQVGIPRVLVNNYLTLAPRDDYLRTHPYASSAFIHSTDFNGILVYRSKHYVISQKLLVKCCERLYNSSFENSLSTLSELLIKVVYNECKIRYSHAYQEILERLFIDKSYNQQSFSQLILDIAAPMSRKYVLECLATTFGSLAENQQPDEAPELYLMASHFYGHLGRLCSKRDGGVENVEDARQYGEKAVALMELASPDNPDPLIYHMYGESCKHCLRIQIEDKQTPPTADEYEEYESLIDNVSQIFDKAAMYGSEDFASISKLGMYILYLKKVYTWKEIASAADISKLSIIQAGYREEIEALLSLLSDLPINDNARELYSRFEHEYRSDIMMNDYGAAIQYYENLLVTLEKSHGRDIEKQDVRRGLISIRMARFQAKVANTEDTHLEMDPKELNSVLDLLEQTLGQTIDPSSYRQRNQRISGYNRWFELAKMKGSNRSMHSAQLYAKRWDELVTQAHINDPRPSYYLYILSALSLLDGNKASKKDMEVYRKRSYELARKAGYRTDNIKDLLVEGMGLNRLLDMRYAKNPVRYIENAKVSPMVFEGTFDSDSGGKGIIHIQSPVNWYGESIRFSLGTHDRSNTIGEQQLSHRLATFAGFSYEQLEAVNKYVRDYTTHEKRPVLDRNLSDQEICAKANKISERLVGSQIPALFTAARVTVNKGLSGTVCVNGVNYPATLPRNCVTKQMVANVKAGQKLQLQVKIAGISPQHDRYLLTT